MENIYQFTDAHTLNDEAAAWLVRLDGDAPLDEELKAELREWMSRSPRHREVLTKLSSMWDKLNVLNELSVPLARPSKRRHFLSLIEWRLQQRWSAALAASVVLGFALLLTQGVLFNAIDASNGVYRTQVGQQKGIALADGSTVQLNTNSRVEVRYGEHYRDIHLLQGEAHFSVAKNKQKPLRVFAGKRRVQAIGTAFAVYLKADDVDVMVTEGRVALASLNETSEGGPETLGVKTASSLAAENLGALSAGQGATIAQRADLDGPTKISGLLENIKIYKQEELDRRLSWRRGLLVFTGEPLEEVVAEISRYTTVDIQIPSAKVRAIKVGGQFEVGDTDMMLDALEDTFELRVVRNGNNSVTIHALADSHNAI